MGGAKSMMKYYKLNNEVFAFDSDQLDYVKPEMVEMTEAEIKDHLNQPQPPIEETLPALTRRQFKLALLENGLLEQVDVAIAAISDPVTKQRIQIEYAESTTFERLNPAVIYMCSTLGLTGEQINTMWQQALAL